MTKDKSLVLYQSGASGEPLTTSEIIAEGAGVQHHTVTRLIRDQKADFEEFGKVGFEIHALPDSRTGQKIKVYYLNEQQATLLLTYLKNTEVVRAFKRELVKQFFAMRSLLLEKSSPVWQDTRSLGKEVRRQETDAIKRLVDYATAQGSRNAAWYYTSLSELANRTVGIQNRDTAQTVQLTALLMVERLIAQEITAGIQVGEPYKNIYKTIKDRLAVFGVMALPGTVGGGTL